MPWLYPQINTPHQSRVVYGRYDTLWDLVRVQVHREDGWFKGKVTLTALTCSNQLRWNNCDGDCNVEMILGTSLCVLQMTAGIR